MSEAKHISIINPFRSTCGCGWWSDDKRYSLKYHADVHKCMKARMMLVKDQDGTE